MKMHMRLYFIACVLTSAYCCGNAPQVIDTLPALQIGRYAVSTYVVEKYFFRFKDAFLHERGRPASANDCAKWLAHFVDQQCLIAQAKQYGYGARPEVVTAVQRMEHYMLTQERGPYYDFIATHTETRRNTAFMDLAAA